MKTRRRAEPEITAETLLTNFKKRLEERTYELNEFRRLIEAGYLRMLRIREPSWTLGYLARQSNLSVVRISQIERATGDVVTDDEIISLESAFYPAVRTVVACAGTTTEGS